jgi:hypothetical protein
MPRQCTRLLGVLIGVLGVALMAARPPLVQAQAQVSLVENGALRDTDATLRQQFKHLSAGQRVRQVPAHRHHDFVHWPAIATEGGQGVLGESLPTWPAGVLLTTSTIEAVAFGGRLLAGGMERHQPLPDQHSASSRTPRRIRSNVQFG